MFCKKCGNEIENDSKFCCYCGTPTNNVKEQLNISENQIEISDVLFFEGLISREIIEKALKRIDKVMEVIGVLLTVLFIYEQYNLNEGYVFWIYVIRYMVRFAYLIILVESIKCISDLFSYRKKDLKNLDSNAVILGCHVIQFLMAFIMVEPFLFVSDGTLAGWVLKFAFVGVEEFFYEFKIQILAIVIRGIVGIYLDNLFIKENSI